MNFKDEFIIYRKTLLWCPVSGSNGEILLKGTFAQVRPIGGTFAP